MKWGAKTFNVAQRCSAGVVLFWFYFTEFTIFYSNVQRLSMI